MPNEPTSLADFLAAWELFRDPLLCALAAGVVLGFLSVYIVLRRMVFVSAAVTQSAGLGVALAFYGEIHLGLTLEPIYVAAALALGATLLLLLDPQKLHLTRESVLGLVFAATGGAAVLVGDRIAQEAHDIQAILFGTAVLVRPLDLRVVLVVGAVVMALHLWWLRGFVLASFDPVAARVQGLPVALLQGLLLVSIGLAVGTTARALGALPVFALSTLPAMAALLLGCGLRLAFLVATLLGALAGVGGYLLAFFLRFPVGASQTATASGFVLVALVVRVVTGLAVRAGKAAHTGPAGATAAAAPNATP